jgi:hypothetical protein
LVVKSRVKSEVKPVEKLGVKLEVKHVSIGFEFRDKKLFIIYY